MHHVTLAPAGKSQLFRAHARPGLPPAPEDGRPRRRRHPFFPPLVPLPWDSATGPGGSSFADFRRLRPWRGPCNSLTLNPATKVPPRSATRLPALGPERVSGLGLTLLMSQRFGHVSQGADSGECGGNCDGGTSECFIHSLGFDVGTGGRGGGGADMAGWRCVAGRRLKQRAVGSEK